MKERESEIRKKSEKKNQKHLIATRAYKYEFE